MGIDRKQPLDLRAVAKLQDALDDGVRVIFRSEFCDVVLLKERGEGEGNRLHVVCVIGLYLFANGVLNIRECVAPAR